jgi:F-type H+-transporting ATPase subunit b
MDSIIETFHIDWKILIAQAVNFAIVFAVLYYLAVKPILKIMQGRTDKIEKSLADAHAVEAKLKQVEKDQKEILTSARAQATEIINEARRLGEEKKNEMVVKAKEEIGNVINQEKQKMQAEKAKIIKEIKGDIAGMVATGIEKVLEKKIDAAADKELIKNILH